MTFTRLDSETFLVVGVIAVLSFAGRAIYRLVTGKELPENPFSPPRTPLDPLDPINHGLLPGDVGYESEQDDRCHVRDVAVDPGHDAGRCHDTDH